MADHATEAGRADDDRWMARCLELAREAGQAGNVPIGTVVLVPGEPPIEVLEGVPAGPDPFGHAELAAVREAVHRLGKPVPRGTILYTNAEPCFMCAFAIREARIGRVVIERPTPDIGGATSRYPILLAEDVPRWGPAPEVVWWRPPA